MLEALAIVAIVIGVSVFANNYEQRAYEEEHNQQTLTEEEELIQRMEQAE